MKVLAADEPLSLQAHPSAAQAGGFVRPRRAQRHPGNGSGAQLAIQYVRSGSKTVAAEARTVLELGERYLGDAGVLAALLLNRLSLRPGETIYLPAGKLHTSLRRRLRAMIIDQQTAEKQALLDNKFVGSFGHNVLFRPSPLFAGRFVTGSAAAASAVISMPSSWAGRGR
jgi:mannose-6-phosphate isomerase class I